MASRPRCSCERRWEGQRKHPAPLQQPLSTFLEAAPSPALNRITTASQASPGLEAGPKLSTASFVQQQLLRPSEPSQLQLAGDRDGGDVLPPILVLPPHPSPLLPLLPGLLYSLPTRSPPSLLTLASFPPHHSVVTAPVPGAALWPIPCCPLGGHLLLTAPSSSSATAHMSCMALPFGVPPECTPSHQTPPDFSHPQPWLLPTAGPESPASLHPWLMAPLAQPPPPVSPRCLSYTCCHPLHLRSSPQGLIWPCSAYTSHPTWRVRGGPTTLISISHQI